MILLLIYALRIVQAVIFIRVVLTWVMPGKLPEPLQKIAEPIDRMLKVFQVLIPMGGAYLDIGPMLCLVLIEVIQRFLLSAHFMI
jgi:YggT family protein